MAERHLQQSQAASVDAFFVSLNLVVKIEQLSSDSDMQLLQRCSQLTHRTNQHNACKRHMSALQLMVWCATHNVLISHSRDRFGHHGIVGLVLMAPAAAKMIFHPS